MKIAFPPYAICPLQHSALLDLQRLLDGGSLAKGRRLPEMPCRGTSLRYSSLGLLEASHKVSNCQTSLLRVVLFLVLFIRLAGLVHLTFFGLGGLPPCWFGGLSPSEVGSGCRALLILIVLCHFGGLLHLGRLLIFFIYMLIFHG